MPGWTRHETCDIRNLHVIRLTFNGHISFPQPSPTRDFLFLVLAHSHGHYYSTDLGTSSQKKNGGHLRMSHRLPKLSFLFPEVEDFLRNSLFSREVSYKAFTLLQSQEFCENHYPDRRGLLSRFISIKLNCRIPNHLFAST